MGNIILFHRDIDSSNSSFDHPCTRAFCHGQCNHSQRTKMQVSSRGRGATSRDEHVGSQPSVHFNHLITTLTIFLLLGTNAPEFVSNITRHGDKERLGENDVAVTLTGYRHVCHVVAERDEEKEVE